MSQRNWQQLIEAKFSEGKHVCVGLDTDPFKLPDHIRLAGGVSNVMVLFNNEIIEATHDIVGFYKPNYAFYERFGSEGLWALEQTIESIHQIAPDVPVILDRKAADIGNTNSGTVEMAFSVMKADAITVNPYLGGEALQPFLDQKDKGIFVLCRTSNPGAGEFQDLAVTGSPLYQWVAKNVSGNWNKNGNCGLVVGATYPDELAQVRTIVGDMPILIPGVGAQGGDLEATVKAARKNFIINSSRDIIYASDGKDFAEAARRETQKLHDSIISALLKDEQ